MSLWHTFFEDPTPEELQRRRQRPLRTFLRFFVVTVSVVTLLGFGLAGLLIVMGMA